MSLVQFRAAGLCTFSAASGQTLPLSMPFSMARSRCHEIDRTGGREGALQAAEAGPLTATEFARHCRAVQDVA